MDAAYPWSGYKVYKVFHKVQGRWYAQLVSESHRTTTAYARYLMEIHVVRRLTDKETVDHINGDRADDRIENLQILTLQDNIKKSYRPPVMIEAVCDYCHKSYLFQKRNVNKRKKNKNNFCRRMCLYDYMRRGRAAY